MLVAGLGFGRPLIAHSEEASPTATTEDTYWSDLFDRIDSDGVRLQFWIDAQGLIDRSKEAREGVVEALEIVLAPYATCEIQLAFVFAGGPRYQAQDLADFVAGTLVTKLPDMTPDAVTLTSEFGDDPWAFGEIRMLVLFNEDCAPASSEGTPVPSASPGQVTATP